MPRKRDTTPPEALLQRVITGLESDDYAIHRRALLLLLAEGPLQCRETLQQEEDKPEMQQWDVGPVAVVSITRLELVAFLRSLLRQEGRGVFGDAIAIDRSVQLRASAAGHRVTWAVSGAVRDVAILQLWALLERVGVRNLRLCSAPDCQRLFVRTYRRVFCSVRCQQRINKKKLRREKREQAEQKELRQARQRQLRKETVHG